ncbi:NlpC/P60 family protein [Propionibacteriaceae bacterium Y1685]|uniref:C40 family peptidase n=1 Tax=Microlunatus sp. Y1700 TaxID=3418487 RepID=UPI003B771529
MTTRIGALPRGLKALLAGTASLALAATLATAPASADPGKEPTTINEAKAQVEKLQTEAAAIDQDYAGAQDRLAKAEASLKTKQADVRAQRGKVDKIKKAVAQYALVQYQNRGVDTTTQLMMTSSPDTVMRQLSVMDRVELTQRGILQDYQTQVANLNDMARSAETEVATIEASKADMAESRKASQAKVAEAQRVLDRLTEEERQRIAAEEAEEARQAQERAEAAEQDQGTDRRDQGSSRSNDRSDSGSKSKKKSGSSDEGDSPKAPAGSGKGAQVVAYAKAQLGAAYVSGGTGPSYDCSGLTMMAYKSAGRTIPRTSQAQYGSGTSIAKGDLQPGDLVFYYSGISHVGIYVGGGQIIHASRPGKPVGYAGLNSMPYMGARRY